MQGGSNSLDAKSAIQRLASSVRNSGMSEEPKSKLREWRVGLKYSLDDVCDLIKEKGLPRPSAAKLSRIERDQQIPNELIPTLEDLTGIPAKELAPETFEEFQKLFKAETAQ